MRLLMILLLVAWIGMSIGCSNEESYKSREADTSADDPGALITDDPALSGEAPAEGEEPAEEGDEAESAEGDEAEAAEETE